MSQHSTSSIRDFWRVEFMAVCAAQGGDFGKNGVLVVKGLSKGENCQGMKYALSPGLPATFRRHAAQQPLPCSKRARDVTEALEATCWHRQAFMLCFVAFDCVGVQ
jgi:hypothetical protein